MRVDAGSGDGKDNAYSERTDSDWPNYAILLILYTLQGIPLGLAATVPMLLQEKGTNYSAQATFSLASWPFSLKLLWAPIVDSIYVQSWGRRKSWLVPVQFAIALLLIVSSEFINGMIREGTVWTLTMLFFALYFLCATQDVAVDGWALTMLKPSNVNKASVCNSIGQSLGFFSSYLLFISLNDVDVCNKYLRSVPSDAPILELGTFFFMCGVLFLVVTSLVAVLKKEEPCRKVKDCEPDGIIATYQTLFKIITLPNVYTLFALLLTSRFGFACVDAMFGLKLQEFGIPKYVLAGVGPLAFPIQLLTPLLVTQIKAAHLVIWTTLARFRIVLAAAQVMIVYYVQFHLYPEIQASEEHFTPSLGTWVGLVGLTMVLSAMSQAMFTSQMQFYNTIADPSVGGTYMTLLNTVTNLGAMLPATSYLKINGILTDCDDGTTSDECGQKSFRFYYIAIFSLTLGVAWLFFFGKRFRALERLPLEKWRVVSSTALSSDYSLREKFT